MSENDSKDNLNQKDSSTPLCTEHSLEATKKDVCETNEKKSLVEVQKVMEEIILRDPFKEIRNRMRTLYVDPLNEIKNRMRTLYVDPLKEIQDRMRTLYVDPLNDVRKLILKYQRITNVYKNIFTHSIPSNTFEEAYQEVFSNFIAAQSQSAGDATEAAICIVEGIHCQAKKFQPSKLSIEFYLNVIIALILFLYSLHLTEQSELRITESINTVQKIIIERLNELSEPKNQETYYVVERAVNLRTKSTTKFSEVIIILYPNQKVRFVEKKGKWIRIEYYNHILNIHENGWCLKKYLKIIR